MDYEETTWINQALFQHTDKVYQTNSSIEITISTNTKDFKYYSIPNVLITITSINNQRRNCSLKFQDVVDLLTALKETIENTELAFEQGFEINRRFQNKDFIIKFMTKDTTRGVLIGIKYSETDKGLIVIDYNVFISFGLLLQQIKDNYVYLSMELQKKIPPIGITSKLEEIKTILKILPSQIEPKVSVPSTSFEVPAEKVKSETPPIEEKTETEEISPTEFDKFLDENIDKANIPELDQIQETAEEKKNGEPVQPEIESVFVDKVLSGKIENYESLINSIYHDTGNPTFKFIDVIKKKMEINDFFPGISEHDRKSISYIPKVIFKCLFSNYLDNGVPMPVTTPVTIKYKALDPTSQHIEFAHDLFLINVYIKAVRQKLESKVSDSTTNLGVLNIASRSFTDVLVFSFLENLKPDVIKNCILTRFKVYQGKGFFQYYDSVLDVHNCQQVTEKEISDITDLAIENVIGQGGFIKDIHDNGYKLGKFKIPSENNFDLEQISNEIVELEVARQFGKSLEGVTNNNELLDFFQKKKTTPKEKAQSYKSSLHRFVNEVDFKDQVPERLREDFHKHVIEISDAKKNFDYEKFPVEEFGDDIVKVIYLWNESDKKDRYSDFRVKHEECMSKDLVIAQIKGTKEIQDTTGSATGDWTALDM